MPKAKTIAQLYLEHENSFIKRLKRAKSLGEQEVHKLRVEIKNLRTLFEFLQALADKKLKQAPVLKLVQPVFKKAGKIRTAQLNLRMTKPYRTATMLRFREYLQKEEEKASKRFIKEIKQFDLEKLEKLHKKNLKAIKKLKADNIESETETFIRTLFAKIRTAMFDMNKDEVLHEIRKHLKTIKNMNRLLGKFNHKEPLQQEIKKVERTYEKIGQWHDGIILAENFENYVRTKEIAEIQEKALALVLKLKEKNEKLKLQLIKKLRAELG